MSGYYKVRIDEYNELVRVITQLTTAHEFVKSENKRLRDDNQRLLNCVEKMALPEAPKPSNALAEPSK